MKSYTLMNAQELLEVIKDLQYERDTLKADSENKTLSIISFIEDKDRLTKENNELKDEIKKINRLASKYKDDADGFEKQSNDLKSKLEDYTDKIGQLEEYQRQYMKSERQLEKEIIDLHTTIKKLCGVFADE